MPTVYQQKTRHAAGYLIPTIPRTFTFDVWVDYLNSGQKNKKGEKKKPKSPSVQGEQCEEKVLTLLTH